MTAGGLPPLVNGDPTWLGYAIAGAMFLIIIGVLIFVGAKLVD